MENAIPLQHLQQARQKLDQCKKNLTAARATAAKAAKAKDDADAACKVATAEVEEAEKWTAWLEGKIDGAAGSGGGGSASTASNRGGSKNVVGGGNHNANRGNSASGKNVGRKNTNGGGNAVGTDGTGPGGKRNPLMKPAAKKGKTIAEVQKTFGKNPDYGNESGGVNTIFKLFERAKAEGRPTFKCKGKTYDVENPQGILAFHKPKS